jgi:hypothetical protein
MVQRRLRPARHQQDGVPLVRVPHPETRTARFGSLPDLRLPADARLDPGLHRTEDDTHRDHATWRADLRLYPGDQAGYFRWGYEPIGVGEQPGRVFEVDNLATIAMPLPVGRHVGGYGAGGESAAHRLLKLYVAAHPLEFGLSTAAVAHVEYPFAAGGRLDVMFVNHLPDRTVIEVEVEGEREVCVCIHQAIKYRSRRRRLPALTSRVRSLVVAYSTDYPTARELADRYDIPLVPVNRDKVLEAAR